MGLKRQLGFWSVFCIATGAMISSGLFVLPGLAYAVAGPAVVLGYALASLMVIPALLSKAELATAMPKSGGDYFFIERSLGALPGTLAGLAAWLSIALKSAFAMVGIGVFARLVWPDADLTPVQWAWLVKLVAVGCCVLFTVLNILSVRITGHVQVAMVAALLGLLGLFVVAGVPRVNQHPNFDNFLDKGMWNVLACAGLVFVSFGGLTKVAGVAEEVRRPGRTIPPAMFLAFGVVAVLYIAAVSVTVGVTPAENLAGCRTPLSLAAGSFLGPAGLVLLSLGAILAFVTTGNSGILAASRTPMAMGRDGLLPAPLAKVSRRFGTPHVAIILTSGFMIAMIVLLDIASLVKVASTMKLILFLLVNLAVIIMRGSRIQNYRPLYRSPLFPWLQLAGIGVCSGLIAVLAATQGPAPLVATGSFALVGLLWYLLYVRPRSDRESALVYMVRSAVSKDIYRSGLEEELKTIALQRDDVTQDRFDRLVRKCEILDLPGSVTAGEAFAQAAALLAPRLGMQADQLLERFEQREKQSSTVIQPGLAIPHVIIDGQGLFDVLPVRCKGGIVFPGQASPVQTAFILVGSPDERNYHLKALMAVAQIVQEPDFVARWLQAPKTEHLRDILLLSSRTRDGQA